MLFNSEPKQYVKFTVPGWKLVTAGNPLKTEAKHGIAAAFAAAALTVAATQF